MSNLSQFFGGGGIKSIQTITLSQTLYGNSSQYYASWSPSSQSANFHDITISSVNTSKTILIVDMQVPAINSITSNFGSSYLPRNEQYVELINSTTVRVIGDAFSWEPVISTQIRESGTLGFVNIQVVEFN